MVLGIVLNMRYTKYVNRKYGLNYFRVLNIFTRSVHTFKDLNPWKDNSEFAQYLLRNVLYYEKGLLALNKPYGISFSRDGNPLQEKSTVEKKNLIHHHDPNETVIKKTIISSGKVNSDLSLVKALPYLKEELKLNKLYVVKCPERYTTGVALLATDKQTIERVQKCVLRSRPDEEAMDTYQAIIMGKPRYTECKVRVGLKLDLSKKKVTEKKPVILKEWSNNSEKRQEVLVTKFYFKTLQRNSDNSVNLVEVSSSRKRWHCIRLFCSTYLLSPVLGDNIYAGQVKTVMGVSVSVDPWSPVAQQPQKFSPEILKLLEVPHGESSIIPLHLHLSQVCLKSYDQKGKDLILTAPAPEFFTWSCHKLGLDFDNVQMEYKALG